MIPVGDVLVYEMFGAVFFQRARERCAGSASRDTWGRFCVLAVFSARA